MDLPQSCVAWVSPPGHLLTATHLPPFFSVTVAATHLASTPQLHPLAWTWNTRAVPFLVIPTGRKHLKWPLPVTAAVEAAGRHTRGGPFILFPLPPHTPRPATSTQVSLHGGCQEYDIDKSCLREKSSKILPESRPSSCLWPGADYDCCSLYRKESYLAPI